MFTDRTDAGIKLAEALKKYSNTNSIILAIPRGGAVVADKVAEILNLPLSLIIPRKIGAPGNLEYAIGATAGEGKIVVNYEAVKMLGVSDEYVKEAAKKENIEIERRQKMYLGLSIQPEIKEKTVIIVDDGIATGSTAEAAILATKSQKADKVILAIPVAPRESIERLKKSADEVVVLHLPEMFYAVGQFYDNFKQTTDDEVVEIMGKYGNSS